jgi:hypothetical protein
VSDAGASRFHIFPWREEEGYGGKRLLRPTLFVTLSSGDLDTTTKALIDTGSPRCVFPRGAGEALSLDFPPPFEATRKVVLMGREWPAVTVPVWFVLQPFDDLGWEAEVDFVLDEGLPFGLLGYEGFLNRWAVSFNAANGYFVVEPAESFAERIPADTFDEFERRYPDEFQP